MQMILEKRIDVNDVYRCRAPPIPTRYRITPANSEAIPPCPHLHSTEVLRIMLVLYRCRGALPRLQEPLQLDFEAGRAVIAREWNMNAKASAGAEEERNADSIKSLTKRLKATNRR